MMKWQVYREEMGTPPFNPVESGEVYPHSVNLLTLDPAQRKPISLNRSLVRSPKR